MALFGGTNLSWAAMGGVDRLARCQLRSVSLWPAESVLVDVGGHPGTDQLMLQNRRSEKNRRTAAADDEGKLKAKRLALQQQPLNPLTDLLNART